MNVPYEKQTLDNPNIIARFAHRTRFKVSKEIVLNWLSSGMTIFDYGCGHGKFLAEICKIIPKNMNTVKLLGYDPYLKCSYEGYTVMQSLETIQDESINILTCLEVLEHLDSSETQDFVEFARKKLVDGGKILVTVPIMVGPALILKELSRCILFRRRSDTSLKELLFAAILGVNPPRTKNIKGSHKGFNWEVVFLLLQKEFSCTRLFFSPFKILGWYGNSQVIMQFQKVGSH